MNNKIGIVLPTRGLVFTRVEQAIEPFRKKHDITVYRSYDLPIPEGHNRLTEEALADGCDYIWLIEEDTVPPAGSLEKMMQANSDIACVDYGVSGWGCVTKDSNGQILWCGLGCTLVKREVFERLEKPFFRTDKTLRLNDWTWQDLPADYVKNKVYGTLDIWFCCQARKAGFKITQIEGEAVHLQLENLGQRATNNGIHQIVERKKIENKQTLNERG